MNQYRCETCKHFKTRRKLPIKTYPGDGLDVGECSHPILKNNNYGIEWLRFILVRDLGCTSHSDFQSERELILDRLDKEIHIREDEMNRKAGLEENLVTVSGYYASAGALNWVRVVLIKGLR